MEEERERTRYWCHACARVVDPIMEVESIKCSLCQSGFMEEMDSHQDHSSDSELGVSLWAPLLLGMMNTPLHQRRLRQLAVDDQEHEGVEDPELESLRRRRRSSAAILQLLQGIRAGLVRESQNNNDESGGDNNQEGGSGPGGRVIFINPFSQTVVVQGGDMSQGQNHPFGDYFLGSGLDQLLQHLAENDPNRYGTPPAQKEAVEAMPTVTIKENCIQCSICLEEFEIGTEARKMPCKHMFHGDCILPWLELHSTCPVCRYQLPADESKINREQQGSVGNGVNNEERQSSLALPWPFSSLFSLRSGSNNINPSPVVTRSASTRSHEDDHQEDGH